MNWWLGFSGLLGLVLFLFGLVGSFMVGYGQPLVLAHTIVGLILMVLWFVQVGLRNLSQAGQAVVGRRARFGYNVTLYTLVFAGLLVVANMYVYRHDRRWDTTSEGVFSLASQSLQVIKDLKAPLKLILLTGTGVLDDDKGKQLFNLYHYANPAKVSVEYLDPRAKPHLLDKYEMKQGNFVYIEYGEGTGKGVSRLNLTSDEMQKHVISEESMTNAVIKLARGAARKIYFVRGHDEPDIDDENPQGIKNLAQAIGDENLKIEGLILAEKPAVPEDASAVILTAPKKSLLPAEMNLLIRYVENGGRLLLFTDPRGSKDVKELAAHFGVEVGDNVVIDQIQRLFEAPALGAQPVVTDYDHTHPITKAMSQNDITIFNIACSVKTGQHKIEGAKYTELLRTGPTAWGESDLAAVFDNGDPVAVFDQGKDLPGPVPLALAFENKVTGQSGEENKSGDAKFEKSARVVVFGDSDWILNANLHVYANRDLVLNSLNWLVGEEGGISLRPRSITAQLEPVRSDTFGRVLASSFIAPEIFLLLGLFIWWRRRSSGA